MTEAISQGSTEEELMDNIREAIELVLEDRAENIAEPTARAICKLLGIPPVKFN